MRTWNLTLLEEFFPLVKEFQATMSKWKQELKCEAPSPRAASWPITWPPPRPPDSPPALPRLPKNHLQRTEGPLCKEKPRHALFIGLSRTLHPEQAQGTTHLATQATSTESHGSLCHWTWKVLEFLQFPLQRGFLHPHWSDIILTYWLWQWMGQLPVGGVTHLDGIIFKSLLIKQAWAISLRACGMPPHTGRGPRP